MLWYVDAMQGLKDLISGERGLLGILLIIAVTVLAAIGMATYEQWADFTKYVFTAFVAGKTVTTVAGLMTAKKDDTANAA